MKPVIQCWSLLWMASARTVSPHSASNSSFFCTGHLILSLPSWWQEKALCRTRGSADPTTGHNTLVPAETGTILSLKLNRTTQVMPEEFKTMSIKVIIFFFQLQIGYTCFCRCSAYCTLCIVWGHVKKGLQLPMIGQALLFISFWLIIKDKKLEDSSLGIT